jgi:hypothetical protein
VELEELRRRPHGSIFAILGESVHVPGSRGAAWERAKLAHLRGDRFSREPELREAHCLYVEMGATGLAERIAKQLGP